MTRAKCLLIIVGNHKTLENDDYFSRLIEYCIDNKALLESDVPSNAKSNKKMQPNRKKQSNPKTK